MWEKSVEFYRDFSKTWLEPLSENVTYLDLAGNAQFWGYHPRIDFRDATFSKVKRLRLACFTFSNKWHLQWLLSLQSLTGIWLETCVILTHAFFPHKPDEEGYPTAEVVFPINEITAELSQVPVYRYRTGWNRYLDAFADSLSQLNSFVIRFNGFVDDSLLGAEGSDRLVKQRYHSFYYGDMRPTEWRFPGQPIVGDLLPKEQLKADEDALERLWNAISKRRTVRV